jgi:hypothetical protein
MNRQDFIDEQAAEMRVKHKARTVRLIKDIAGKPRRPVMLKNYEDGSLIPKAALKATLDYAKWLEDTLNAVLTALQEEPK